MGSFQLTGVVDDSSERIHRLEQRVRQLDEALRLARNETGQTKAALGEMKRLTLPFFQLLRAIHGEIDALGVSEEPLRSNSRWDSAKQRMPGKPSEFIDLLISHGAMNVTNFVTLARCSKQTAYNVLAKLGQAGIVQNSGGKYSLKG